jgi:aspartyl-tRNA(Asn)/glutamyl-tRNA(Gln) amidotransferase subunit A
MSGVFVLKPTFGRIPMSGHGLPWGSSVTHVGPLASNVEDIAHFLEVTAGPHAEDDASRIQPPLAAGELVGALGRGVRGLRIGVDEAQWARAGDSITRPCREALTALEKEGAILVEVTSHMAAHAPAIGYLTIALEGVAGMVNEQRHLDDLSPDLQLLIAVVNAFRPDDYVLAQRLRGALRRETLRFFADVDLLALPSLAGPPPKVSDSEELEGFLDPDALEHASAFVYVGNLCGNPAGTAPVGFDDNGLPVGLQILGDAWDEASVVQVLAHLERLGVAEVKAGPNHQDLVSGPA